LKTPSATATGYFDSDQPFAIVLDVAAFYACSLESSLQRAQRHAVDSAKLASRQPARYKLIHQPLDLLARAPAAWFNFFGFRHQPTSPNSPTKW
jgi:hypothetical protein